MKNGDIGTTNHLHNAGRRVSHSELHKTEWRLKCCLTRFIILLDLLTWLDCGTAAVIRKLILTCKLHLQIYDRR